MSSADEIRTFARLRALCEGAWELDSDDRPSWLEAVCVDAQELDQVRELLRRAEERGTLADLFDPGEGL